jgi:hypothetical protein
MPGKLASMPDEPPLPAKAGKKISSDPTTWYDQQDLTFLWAWNNQIVELQTKISLFGSVKTIDICVSKLVHSSLSLTSGRAPRHNGAKGQTTHVAQVTPPPHPPPHLG